MLVLPGLSRSSFAMERSAGALHLDRALEGDEVD